MSVEILEAGPKGAKGRSVFDFDGAPRVVSPLGFAFGKRECSRRIVGLALSGLTHVNPGDGSRRTERPTDQRQGYREELPLREQGSPPGSGRRPVDAISAERMGRYAWGP